MEITITAVGSRGDVQPHVALGRGLADAGHEVKIAVDMLFENLVRAAGAEFRTDQSRSNPGHAGRYQQAGQ